MNLVSGEVPEGHPIIPTDLRIQLMHCAREAVPAGATCPRRRARGTDGFGRDRLNPNRLVADIGLARIAEQVTYSSWTMLRRGKDGRTSGTAMSSSRHAYRVDG